jgi:tetrathionate reductase subunit B
MSVDRRTFLGLTGQVFLFTVAGHRALQSLNAQTPATPDTYDAKKHWWGLAIDVEKCIGCGHCGQACKVENDVPTEHLVYRTWIERYHVHAGGSEEIPDVDSPKGGMEGFPEKYPANDGAKSFFVPKLCNHCEHSPCVQVCPVGATFESPDGVALVDSTYCLGCRYCVQACPYGCRFIDPRTNTVGKCTLCYHRITKGLLPACVEACPTGARQLGDLKNPQDPIHEFLRTKKVQVLKPHMATGSKAFYAGLDASVR